MKIKIFIIVILSSILSIMCYFYFKEYDNQLINQFKNSEKGNIQVVNGDTENKIVDTKSEVISNSTEYIELHATYYLEEIYVKSNQEVKAGENILKYTNGTYLTAPYDCVIGEINVPVVGEQCTNQNNIQISAINTLALQIRVSETKISKLSIGQEVEIKIQAYEDKVITGNIVNISNTASSGYFTVIVEFQNDGDIKIGMTANAVILDKFL